MLNLTASGLFVILLTGHFIGDYVLQSDYLNNNKGKNSLPLFLHIVIYFITLFSFALLGLDPEDALALAAINSVTHLGIDFITSKVITRLGEIKVKDAKIVEEFDVSTISVYWPVLVLGLDQLLHQIILWLSFLEIADVRMYK